MSYRMYIASHSKQSSLEKTHIFSQVILPDMQKDDAYKTYFANYKCLEKFGCTDELELNKEPVSQTILKKCPSYLPKELLRNYPDYLPQSSDEENYIGLLTPELLWEYIQKLHQTQITELKQKLQQCQTDPDYAREFATAILCCQITDWDTSLKHLNPNQLPFCITNSEIHFLYQVYTLYQKTDFKTTDLILYGW